MAVGRRKKNMQKSPNVSPSLSRRAISVCGSLYDVMDSARFIALRLYGFRFTFRIETGRLMDEQIQNVNRPPDGRTAERTNTQIETTTAHTNDCRLDERSDGRTDGQTI